MNWKLRVSQMKAVLGITHGSRAFGGPYQALLSLTNRCNIRCIHCIYHSPYIERPNFVPLRRARHFSHDFPSDEDLRSLRKGEADSDRTMALIDELMSMGTRRFQFSANGEPFLHKNALDFMARAKHAGSICLANTNGTMLNRTMIDSLITMGFDELQVTTMAGCPEVYQRIHPSSRNLEFDILKENLLYLSERKHAEGVRRPHVTLCYVVVSQNFDGLIEFARFASLVRADRVLFRPFFDVEDPELSQLIPAPGEASSVREQMREVNAYFEGRKIKNNTSNFLKVFGVKLDTTALYRVIPCYYGWLSSVINAEGEVYPCCRCHIPLGNIREKTFSEIWNGKEYRQFRKEAVQINTRQNPVYGCDCYRCANFNANLSSYRMLHPVKRQGSCFKRVTSSFTGEDGGEN